MERNDRIIHDPRERMRDLEDDDPSAPDRVVPEDDEEFFDPAEHGRIGERDQPWQSER